MKKIFFFLSVVFTTLSVCADIRVNEDYHDNFKDLKIMTFERGYIIDIPKPDNNGISTLYLSVYPQVNIFNILALNNIEENIAANNNLEGTAAKKIRLVFQDHERITLNKEFRILGKKADLEIIGLKEFICNACSFENSDSVIIKTGKTTTDLETEGDGSFKSYHDFKFEGKEFHVSAKEIEFPYPIDNSYKLFLNFYNNTVIDRFIGANDLTISTIGSLNINKNAYFEGNSLEIKSNNIQVEYGAQFSNYEVIKFEVDKVLTNRAYVEANNIYLKADEIYITTGPYYKQYGSYTIGFIRDSPYIIYNEPETVTWDGSYVMYKKVKFAVPAYDIEKMQSEKATFQALNLLKIDSENIYNSYGFVSANIIKIVEGIRVVDSSKQVSSLEKIQIRCYSKEYKKYFGLPKGVSRCSEIPDVNNTIDVYEPKWVASGPSLLVPENSFLTP